MSGFPLKRKKYSWLPESNPSALSGDTGSPASSSKKSESSEKTPRQQQRSRSKANGKGKGKEKTSDAEQPPQTPRDIDDPAMVVDVLGISTPAPKAISITPTSAETNDEPPIDPVANDGQEPSRSAGDDNDSSDVKQKTVESSSKARHRPRKDSVDDLVRSRFISNLTAQHEGGAPSGSGLSRSRKRTSDPAQSTITAKVRDALASERSGHLRLPSGSNASHEASAMSLAATGNANGSSSGGGDVGRGGRHRNAASHRHGYYQSSNNASGVSTQGRQFAQMAQQQQQPPRMGPLESKYSFPTYPSLNPRNVTSTMRRGDQGVGPLGQLRGLEVPTGDNVIVINAGSRWLRIGRASDAVPREIPHVIARRFKGARHPVRARGRNGHANATDPALVPEANGTGSDDKQHSGISTSDVNSNDGSGSPGEMDVDKNDETQDSGNKDGSASNSGSGDEDGDSDGDDSEDLLNSLDHENPAVDSTLKMLRDALKQHQRQSKRKVPPNVYAQVLTYNKQSKAETIVDHNDPFRVEWIPSSEIGEDHVVGERVLRIADVDDFIIRYPIRNGYINVEDYESIEEAMGDIETIWASAIQTELGVNRRDLKHFGVVLVIPDLYSRAEVIALSEMLLRRMGFQYLIMQQSSTLVTYGAGFSGACVVDVGAQKTSVACVEDGFCYQESRVNVMYGGDDITRFLYRLFMSSRFPYHEASLGRMYDWHLLNGLRERYCTMNLSDVNIRLHDFFVRIPNQPTRKMSFKAYDEAYQAPLCLFYPAIVDAYYQLPDYSQTFANALYAETYGEVKPVGCSTRLTPTQFGILPSRAVETEAEPAPQKPTPEAAVADSSSNAIVAETATAPATVPSTEPGTPDPRDRAAGTPTPAGKLALGSAKTALQSENAGVTSSHTSPSTPSVPNVFYVPDHQAQDTRMPLDAAITHSIANAGSADRAKKLYSSIVIVGGGVSFIPGFDDLLASRLMYMRPDYLQGVVERAEIVSAPRDLDPRVLAWKGGAVLSRLECAREMWISSSEWADFGPKLLRDRVLFPW
ncbi:actin-like protein arp8 [Coemansia sp. RSA 1933]|nr:actin-like protein arp8 [Coemansia sp. RSA 1933]